MVIRCKPTSRSRFPLGRTTHILTVVLLSTTESCGSIRYTYAPVERKIVHVIDTVRISYTRTKRGLVLDDNHGGILLLTN